MSAPRRLLSLVGLGLIVALTGCIDAAPAATPSPEALPAVEPRAPADPLTVVADSDPGAASIALSEALFASAPAAVVGAPDDATAASAAVALGVPHLVAGEEPKPLQAELERLGARYAVVADGTDAELDGVDTVALPRTAADASDALGVDLPACSGGSAVADILALDPAAPCLIEAEATSTPSPAPDAAALPKIPRGEPVPSAVALLAGDGTGLAAAATARAAGTRTVLLPPDDLNPQRSPDAIAALSAQETNAVLAVGAGFAEDAALDWRIRSARTGWQLPGGGQVLFPNHFVVAIYGTPGAPVLGILGEQDLPASIERARQHADPYRALTDREVVPAFEIITSIASGSPTTDGDYSSEIDLESLRPWVEEAGRQGLYVVLDLQPGRTDFLTQAKRYEALLSYPWVGLALDPEWRIGPDQKHLVQIGSVGADEINSVVDWLAQLADEKSLPPKLLVLHQFRLSMITDRDRVDTSRPQVTVLVHADGQGGQGAKQDTWNTLRRDTTIPWWGWKNFYDEDAPMLSPEQTMSGVAPTPDLITYQ
ncbi:hypothetical protein [Naasia sp. SYSU D00057]|uniref:hypothetical protein n=1 Tax=Naasia sp. SYSU D00057 TaxID=2817380 RepID=UPI001B30B12B|nr:hypothetical protein [Naasia sp. SYSU D00057]